MIVGVAADDATSAESTANRSSGTPASLVGNGSLAQLLKEPGNVLPNLRAAGKSFPVHPDQSRQPVALVNRRDVVVGRLLDSVDEQGLNIVLNRGEPRFVLHNVRPDLGRHEGL